MKYILLIFLFASCKEKTYEHSMVVYSYQTHIPMSEYDRKVTGYDSIQLIINHGKLEANFCYPNKWEFEKWKKKDTVYIHDTIYKK